MEEVSALQDGVKDMKHHVQTKSIIHEGDNRHDSLDSRLLGFVP